MSCFCGECPYCRRTDSNLNIELAAAKDEIRIGASLCAKLTDTKNDLESELAAAKEKIDKINSLHGYILLERHNQIDTLESENKRLQAEIEKLKAENEVMLWNMAGCSTFALGYGIDEPFDESRARACMFDVLRLAKREKRLREALKSYASCCDGCTCGDGWDHEPAQSALDGKGGEA